MASGREVVDLLGPFRRETGAQHNREKEIVQKQNNRTGVWRWIASCERPRLWRARSVHGRGGGSLTFAKTEVFLFFACLSLAEIIDRRPARGAAYRAVLEIKATAGICGFEDVQKREGKQDVEV